MPAPAVQLSNMPIVVFALIWQDRRHDLDPWQRYWLIIALLYWEKWGDVSIQAIQLAVRPMIKL